HDWLGICCGKCRRVVSTAICLLDDDDCFGCEGFFKPYSIEPVWNRTSKEGWFNVRYALACCDVTNKAAGFQVGFVLVTSRQAKAYRTLNALPYLFDSAGCFFTSQSF